jgi:hypothetical protein
MADPAWVEETKSVVEVGGFLLAIWTAWSGINKAHRDRQESLAQGKRDFEWRQTVEAQSAIRRLYRDVSAQNAMTMLDWNGRHFKIRDDLRESITWTEMRHALRVVDLHFKPKEVFVRNSFDALFDNFQLIQQQISTGMFAYEHVLYPIAYYSRRIKHPNNWPAFEAFLRKYNFGGAMQLIEKTYTKSAPSGETDMSADLEEDVRVEEKDG